MRILVTGAQGVIGSALVRELRARKHVVFGVGRRHSDDSYYMRADVADFRQLERAFGVIDFQFVYHLAAEFGRHNGQEYYEDMWRTNVVGTRNVLDLCASSGVRLALASSSEVYGEGFHEGKVLYEHSLEYMQPVHSNEYAISKWTNELQAWNCVRRTGLEVAVLRFFNAYGPGEPYTPYRSVVAQFCYRALRRRGWEVYDGYSRTFMHMDDFIPTLANVCDGFVQGTYNIGGVDYRSVSELSALVAECAGAPMHLESRLPMEEHNVVSKRPDIGAARRLFGHDPTITLEQGIPGTVEWMRQAYAL